jgi:hypothetical protein
MISKRAAVRIVIAGLALLAAFLLVRCTIQKIEGPLYVPQPVTEVPPNVEVPEEFFGCWRGTLTGYDTARSFSPAISDSSLKGVRTTYQFCYDKRPDGGGTLELTGVEIEGREAKITHFENHPTSVDVRNKRATMRSRVTMESTFWVLIIPVHIAQDIYVQEALQLTSRDVIAVQATQWIVVGGNLIGEMTFHADFHRVPGRHLTARAG